jgi:hypothetical protein
LSESIVSIIERHRLQAGLRLDCPLLVDHVRQTERVLVAPVK